jgi:Arc/MetJ family transcription regulator
MVKRTSVNLDMELVGEASAVLGTERMTETVHAALREVVRRKRLHELAQRDFPDLTLEALEEMRRPRTFDHLDV